MDKDLLEIAKEEAKAQNRSFSNYIENLLSRELGNIHNKERKKKTHDNHYDLNLTRVDDFDKWLESLLNGESDI